MSEAAVHFEFYRHLRNAIDDDPSRGNMVYSDVRPEFGKGINGFADIVLFDSAGDPVVVIEAKASDSSNRSRNEIDPYAPKVIRQAFGYAGDLGAPYFSTFNGERLVIFDAYEEGVPLLQRSTKSYEISNLRDFADTLLNEIARIRSGDTNWDSNDDAFIERVRSIHEKITPNLEESLKTRLENNEEFHNRFCTWTESQGIDYEDGNQEEQAEVRTEFAEQATYLLVNKIIFYKILENSQTYTDDLEPMAVSPFRVQQDLQEYFSHIVKEIDFEPIFEHDEIYSEIPLDPVADRIREYIIELDDQNLQQFDSDVIGRIYEGVIPAERRHEMGEYYTPPEICDLITRLTIDEPNDKILDPGCGSGGFLISSYNRKRDLMPQSEGAHSELLQQIYGVEINRFPAHLSSINLALQELSSYTESVNVEVANFFDVEPDTLRFGRETAEPGGGEQETEMVTEGVGSFDAVIGNPPYRRFQNISQKEKIRSHLKRVDAEYLSGFSDIYCYFITHATEFIREGENSDLL